jgi:hypothetical protein
MLMNVCHYPPHSEVPVEILLQAQTGFLLKRLFQPSVDLKMAFERSSLAWDGSSKQDLPQFVGH